MNLGLPSFVWNVDPVLANLGGYPLRWYVVCLYVTLCVGFMLFSWQLRRGGGDLEEVGDFLAYACFALLFGARLGHALFYDFDKAIEDPAWVFRFWTGGTASHGALLGLGLAMYWFTRRRAIPFLEGSDRLSFAVAFGAISCRVGNLFNSEIVGKPTDGSWGMRFPRFELPSSYAPLRYPTQIYEILLGTVVLALLLVCDAAWGRERRPRGALTGALLTSYFVGRFAVEFWKDPQGETFGTLDMGQVLSVPFIAVGIALLWRSLRKRRPAGWIVGLGERV